MRAATAAQVLTAALALLLSAEAVQVQLGVADWPDWSGDDDGVAAFPFASERLQPNRPDQAADGGRAISKRSTTVFRPLFATRERDAERREMQDRRREYWANEQRRRSAPAAAYPAYPAYAYAPAYPGAPRPAAWGR